MFERFDFGDNNILLGMDDDMPPCDFDDIFLDFETASDDDRVMSTNPFDQDHCRPLGFGFTGDDDPRCWFIPWEKLMIHRDWFQRLLYRAKRWINHNIPYDAHVLLNNNFKFEGEYVDTLTLAKIHDADRMFKPGGYQLKGLVKAWLKKDIEFAEIAIKRYLAEFAPPGAKLSKDYGRIALDDLAYYGCTDVQSNRELFNYLRREINEQCIPLVKTEISLTRLVIELAQRGLKIDLEGVEKAARDSLGIMLALRGERGNGYNGHLKKLIDAYIEEYGGRLGTGFFDPDSNKDMKQLFCVVMGITDFDPAEQLGEDFTNEEYEEALANESVSFDKGALIDMASGFEESEPEYQIIKSIRLYRKERQHNSLFWEPWQKLQRDSTLHPQLNQNVRSGRMSCTNPNAQQLDKRAKKQIKPRDGMTFVSIDYSQIEYRTLVDVLCNEKAIKAYNDNPDIDWHSYIAESCEIPRKPAKNVNFAIGFGAGERRVINMLKLSRELMTGLSDDEAIEARAREVFNSYHENLPELRPTSKAAERVAKKRGYVINRYGRHLHLDHGNAYKAFNRIVQSTAADLMKERLLAVNEWLEANTGARVLIVVHDEIMVEAPHDEADDVQENVSRIMCSPSVEFKVPILVDAKQSAISWGDC